LIATCAPFAPGFAASDGMCPPRGRNVQIISQSRLPDDTRITLRNFVMLGTPALFCKNKSNAAYTEFLSMRMFFFR
jgi:hypothetical protein